MPKKNFIRIDNPVWAFVAAFLYLLLFSWSTSPLYLTYGGDSPFFQIIGLGITQGKIPYVDLFDHKGPVPFFMDALGYSLGIGKYGIFVFQVISMTVSICLFYKIAGLFTTSDKKAAGAVALSLLALADFITEGNQVEEWQLPYVSLTLLLIFGYIRSGSGRHPLWKSLIYGLCFGLVLFNRPNDGVMWVGSLFFGLMIMWTVRREYKMMFANTGAFIGGTVLAVLPFILWFASKDALPDLWYGMVVHNVKYASDALFSWGGIGMILIPAIFVVVTIVLTSRDGFKDFRYVLIPMLVFTVALIGKRDYYHYLIPFTPYIAAAFALCLEHGWKAFVWVVSVLFAVFMYRESTYIINAFKGHDRLESLYEQSDALFEAVPEGERNSVWNYNLVSYTKDRHSTTISLMGCFLHAGVTPSSPVLASYDLLYLEDRFGVRTYEPEWLIMCPSDSYQKDFDYIFENYDLVASSPDEPVCELRLYKRKSVPVPYAEH